MKMFRGFLMLGAIAAGIIAAVDGRADNPPTRLDVTARPDDAKVIIDGVSKGVVPVSVFDLEPGRRFLRVEAPGRVPCEEVIKIEKGEFLRKDYDLEQEKGLLFLKSDPAGAAVKHNGVSLGVTPLLLTDFVTGRNYTLDFEHPGYQTKRITVNIPDRRPVARTEKLTLDSGIVECITEPAGATVQVNGIVRGQTPCVVERVPKGHAMFVFRLRGYEDVRRELRIVPGDRQTLSLPLVGKAAKLSVISYPDGAKVTLDDNYVGKTPLVISPIAPGVHTIRAELAGFAPVFKTVVMRNGEEVTEEFKFESILGWIEVITTPPGARITLDGKLVGVTAAHRGKKADLAGVKSDTLYIRDVAAGEHSFVAQHRGYLDVKRKIWVNAKEGTQVGVRLKRVFIPDTEIETVNGTYRGVLMDSDNPGTYRLEVKEGITQDFRKTDVRSIKTIE